MMTNNKVELTGIMGQEARIIKTDSGLEFAVFGLGSSESYKNKETDEYEYTDTIWHDVVIFSPSLIQEIKNYKKLTRLKVTGAISYKDFKVDIDGKVITKKEASIIASKIEQAALPKKKETSSGEA
jgi:single-stranded DNA-binding protein